MFIFFLAILNLLAMRHCVWHFDKYHSGYYDYICDLADAFIESVLYFSEQDDLKIIGCKWSVKGFRYLNDIPRWSWGKHEI